MRKILTQMKKYSIIFIAVTAILGVLLIAFPQNMLAYTALFIGGALIACGVFAIISYIIKKGFTLTLTLGILSVVGGLIICLAYRQIMSVMVFILGIYMLVGGVVDLVNSFYVAAVKRRSWILTVVLSIASITLGIFSIVNPFHTQDAIVQFVGAGLLVFAALDLIAYIQVAEIAKSIKEQVDNARYGTQVKEVDFIETDEKED